MNTDTIVMHYIRPTPDGNMTMTPMRLQHHHRLSGDRRSQVHGELGHLPDVRTRQNA